MEQNHGESTVKAHGVVNRLQKIKIQEVFKGYKEREVIYIVEASRY